MKKKITYLPFLIILASVILGAGVASAIAAPSVEPEKPQWDEDGLKPVITSSVRNDVSPALRDISPVLPETGAQGFREIPRFPLSRGEYVSRERDRDTAVQNTPGSVDAMPAPIMNFEGVHNVNGVAPPDTQGDIGYDPATGKKYYVQWVNLSFAIWDVTAGTPGGEALVYGPVAGNTLWQGFGGDCENTNHGDPITLFDTISQRWLMSQFAVNDPFYQCIAVSKTGDPTGQWHRYAFEWKDGLGSPVMNDYPKFGVWPDGYYITANQFKGNSWAGTGVAAFEREKMLEGQPARMVYFDLGTSDWGGMLPSDLDGTTLPASGAPNYFIEAHATEWDSGFTQDELAIYEFDVNWTNTISSTFTQVATLPTAPFDGGLCNLNRDCIPQPGTSDKLDAISERLMYRLAYRNFSSYQSLVGNLTVDADGSNHAGIRWFEVRNTGGTWTIYQEGTYAPDVDHRWMGSIAQDHIGNMALGFSVSSSDIYPAVRYTGRLESDPLGQMAQGESTLFAGSASQTGVNRWGDYSMMGVDPIDDCTFWYTQEYSTGGWNWRTRIGSFRFPTCGLASGVLNGTVTDASNTAPISNVQIEATSDPTYRVSDVSGMDGAYSMELISGTYTVTASFYGYNPETVTGLVVLEGVTTTQDFTLSPADSYVVSGAVTDANTGWPLYASIRIAGYLGGSIWTDPVSGFYSVTLVSGVSYTFDVSAWVDGYNSSLVNVGPLSGDRVEDIQLSANTSTCTAPGYRKQLVDLITENFDTWPPAGWSILDNSTGGACPWHDDSTEGLDAEGNLTLGTGTFADADSDNCGVSVTADTELQSPAFDASVYEGVQVDFVYDFQTYSDTDAATVDLYDGSSWTSIWARPAGDTNGEVSVSGASSAPDSQVRFHYYDSNWEWWWQVDEVQIRGVNCISPTDGGLVVGNVFDANTTNTLAGVAVNNDSGERVVTGATTDKGVDESFYTIYSPSGSHVFTATHDLYGPDVFSTTVYVSDTVLHDFNLPAGQLSVLPSGGLDVSLSLSQATRQITLTNGGTLPAYFELVEINLPPASQAGLGPFASHTRHISPKHLHDRDASFVYPHDLPDTAPLDAGSVIQTWASGLIFPWGTGFNTLSNDLWLGNIGAAGGDDLDYRFLTNGTNAGDTIDTSTWVGTWAADMTYNPHTGMLWQVNVGGDNCIYEMNPTTLTATGGKICPAFGSSERGLAFYPGTNTFYSGSWNDSIIYHFDGSGVILDSTNVGLGISGLAFNPATDHLFVMTNSSAPSKDVYVLDTAANYSVLGWFDIAGLGDNDQAGLEIDCKGHLWAVNQSDGSVIEADSGETGVCDWMDIPWLSLSPITGTVSSIVDQVIEVTFNGGAVNQPGTYKAQLQVLHDTPYSVENIPVTMRVSAPPTWGKLDGNVRGLGYCDANPAPLEGASVLIEEPGGVTTTLETDSAGSFSSWVDQASSGLTLTVSYADHVMSLATGVQITGQTTTTVDLDMRWLGSCVGLDPQSVDVTVSQGYSRTVLLGMLNDGAAPLSYEIGELIGTPIPATITKLAERSSVDARRAPLQVGFSSPVRITSPDGMLISEGFEDGVIPPSGWTQVITNAYTWAIKSTSPHSGTFYADVEYDPALKQQDEWLLSPEINLTDGTLSFWSFGSVYWCRDTYDNCDLSIWIVVGELGGGDDIYIGKADGDWPDDWVWTETIFNLAPFLPGGLVRIGFQYEGVDGAEIALDDILLDGVGTSDVPWLYEDPITGTVGSDSSSDVEITLSTWPTMTLGTYSATLQVTSNDLMSGTLEIPVTLTVVTSEYGVDISADMVLMGTQGSSVTYTLAITNTSYGPADTFSVTLGTHNYPTWLNTGEVGPLNPRETTNVNVLVSIPSDALYGEQDTVTITVTSQNDETKTDTVSLTTIVGAGGQEDKKVYLPIILQASSVLHTGWSEDIPRPILRGRRVPIRTR